MAIFYGQDGEKYLGVSFEKISMLAADHLIGEMIWGQVRLALSEDEDFRILVREGVREAISRLNIAELIALAVKDQLEKPK